MTKSEYKRYCHHYRRHDYRAAVAESRGRTELALSYRRAQLDWSRMLPGDTRRVTWIAWLEETGPRAHCRAYVSRATVETALAELS